VRFGVIVIVLLLATAIAANFLLADPGYVSIMVRGYVVEMSVPVLAGLVILLVLAIWAVRLLVLAPRRLGEAAGRFRAARAGEKMTRGMIAVAEGDLARGEKLLARAASTSDSPLFNYLQAARAAHLQGEDARRDEWLRIAYQEIPEAANAVLLTQAEFQIDREQFEQALATLRRLEETTRNHAQALALLGRLYFRLQDWESLARMLPRLQKNNQVKPDILDAWTVRVHQASFDRVADAAAVDEAWKAVPRRYRGNPVILEAYYRALMRAGLHDRVEKELAAELRGNWAPELVRLFGLVEATDTTKQLKRAESWLRQHDDDPDLLLTAARLCVRNELWGKARSYLETVISLRPSPEVYREYGGLLTQLGKSEAAARAYRDGLGMVGGPARAALPGPGNRKA